MNHMTYHLIFTAALLIIACPLIAQDIGVGDANINENATADHDALRELKALYEQAIAEENVELLKPHVHVNFTGVMVTNESVDSFTDLEAYWAHIKKMMGDDGQYTVTVKPAKLSDTYGDIVLSHGTTEDQVTSGGKVYHFTSQWTAVLQKVDGCWFILRIHGSMNPIDNPFIDAKLRWNMIGSAFASAVVVFIICGVIGKMRKRKA